MTVFGFFSILFYSWSHVINIGTNILKPVLKMPFLLLLPERYVVAVRAEWRVNIYKVYAFPRYFFKFNQAVAAVNYVRIHLNASRNQLLLLYTTPALT